MGAKWVDYVRTNGELKVFDTGGWAGPVQKAITEFNKLNLGVKLVPTKEQKDANIVVSVATGAATPIPFQDRYLEGSVSPKAGFRTDQFHGYCGTLSGLNSKEIVFAGIFLPGLIKATDDQKMIVTLHEFIHACGLNGATDDGGQNPNQDHDPEGIMAGLMEPSGKGMIEYLKIKGAKAMPPVRISAKSRGLAQQLWS